MLQLSQAKLQITMFCREWPYNGLYHLHSAHTDPTKHWTDIGYNFLWFYKNIINNKHLLYSNTDWTALSRLTVYLSSSSSAMGITPSSYFIMLLDLLLQEIVTTLHCLIANLSYLTFCMGMFSSLFLLLPL